jgi:hypothetical protein
MFAQHNRYEFAMAAGLALAVLATFAVMLHALGHLQIVN